MQLLRENAAQWIALLMNLAALLAFVATVALAARRWQLERRGAQAEELAKLDRARGALEGLLKGSVFGLVTAAEREYGPGTGEIKRSAVLSELLRLLPEQWRAGFSEEALGAIIENGLAAAKEIWARQK